MVAGAIYKRNKSKKTAVIALGAGTLTMTVLMIVMNLIFTPLFMGVPINAVLGMLLPIIIPFNLMKAGINSIITFLLYKSTGKLLGV